MRLTVIRHEIVVGWFIVAALLLTAVGILLTTHSKGFLGGVAEFQFTVPHGRGLRPGAPVEMQGIEVGEVGDMELLGPKRVVIKVMMSKRYAAHLMEDAVARVVQPPLLGTTKVEIDPGESKRPAEKGQELKVEEGDSLMGRIGDLEGKVDGVITRVDTFVASAVKTLDEFRRLVDRIDSSQGLAGQVIHDPQLAKDVRSAIVSVESIAKRLDETGVDKALSTLEQSEKLVSSLNDEQGELRKLLRDLDEGVLALRKAVEQAQVEETVASLRTTAETLTDTAQKMEVSEETRKALAAMQKASEAFQVLARELERQPNSVIFGRTSSDSPKVRR